MSASTVSATANTRRRTTSAIAVTDVVKQSIDIAPSNAAATRDDNDDVLIAPSAGGTNKDLSHSIKGETQINNNNNNIKKPTNSTVRARTRKNPSSSTVKPVKPRWKTVVSVLGKNLLLVIVVAGLVQMVRKLGFKEELRGDLLGFSDMEGRISSVEKSMRTTTTMLQVQVEVLDKKIESEVGNLRREVVRRVDDKGTEIEGKLAGLKAKNDELGVKLSELKEVSDRFVSKEDVIRMYNELRGGNGVNEASLDEILGLAREVVESEIEKHAADGLGRVDYALGSGGAKVVKHSDPLKVGKRDWFASSRQGVHENAVRMLSPSFGEPGMCFALEGSTGFVEIRLRTAVVPEAVTLEHVAKSVAYDQSSAPKDCRVVGWFEGSRSLDSDLNVEDEKVLLAEFTYDLEKSNAQTSNVVDSAVSTVIDTVRFEFSSNHGSPTHTCIYRLRVHGHDPNPVAKIA